MDIILQKPVISEKSTKLAAKNMYTFLVDKNARKSVIAKAVKEMFGVDPVSVKVANFKGEKRQQRSRKGRYKVSDVKKAIIALKKGQNIPLFNAEEIQEESIESKGLIKEKKSRLRGTKVRIEAVERKE